MIIGAKALHLRQSRGEHFLLIDVRDVEEWRDATLPGAQHCNVYDYFIEDCTEQGLAVMATEAAAALAPLFSTDPSATPVFFEDQVGMRSPRGAWFSWLIGRDDALILDGGMASWRDAGFATDPGRGISRTIAHLPAPAGSPWNARVVCSREQMIHADGLSAMIVDARRPSEFDGSFVHSCCSRAGRIPGAKLLFWENVIENSRFCSPEVIKQRALAAGLSQQAHLQVYCHRGARAATVMAALRLAGFNHVSVYVGSWHEWAGHGELPLAFGHETL